MESNHPVTPNTTATIWRVRLVHAELGARVVEASCEEGGQLLAMALGEAATAEVAEDQARRRAAQVLLETGPAPGRQSPLPPPPTPVDAPAAAADALETGDSSVQSTASPHPAPPEEPEKAAPEIPAPPRQPEPQPAPPPPPAAPSAAAQPAVSPQPAPSIPQPSLLTPDASEPADWSEDLAMVEVQLGRLGWDRNQESVYLERSFGHMERSGITRYQDLRLYMDALQRLSPPADPCTAPLPGHHGPPPPPPLPSRELLIRNGNTLLRQLGWTTDQGRAFLKHHFGHTSRQALSDEQLMEFNQHLDAHQVTGGGGAPPVP